MAAPLLCLAVKLGAWLLGLIGYVLGFSERSVRYL
jgi:hypothetical protein